MFRIIFRKPQSILFCSAVPTIATTNSANSINKTDDNASTKMKEFVFVETGWDRVRNIFKSTKHEAFSPELRAIQSITSTGLFVGSILGSFVFSRRTYMHFMENNHGSQFESHLDAKAVLTNNMIRSMIRGALSWGGRTALLTFSWVFVTRTIGAYQNENGWHNNIGGGVVTGALAGYLFRDLKKLQIDKTIRHGRLVGGPLSVLGGAAAGCLIGGAWGAVQTFDEPKSFQSSIRYWENYWSAYEQEKRRQDPNYKPDN